LKICEAPEFKLISKFSPKHFHEVFNLTLEESFEKRKCGIFFEGKVFLQRNKISKFSFTDIARICAGLCLRKGQKHDRNPRAIDCEHLNIATYPIFQLYKVTKCIKTQNRKWAKERAKHEAWWRDWYRTTKLSQIS